MGFILGIKTSGPSDLPNLLSKQREFERLAYEYGFDINKCKVVRQFDKELQKSIDDYGATWKLTDLGTERQILSSRCLPSNVEESVYLVELSLDVDPELGNQRRVTIAFIPHGRKPGKEMRGGYAHRPFKETVEWSDMIARALERTVTNINDPPTLHISGPPRVFVGDPVVIHGEDSWDTDGDPFEIRWSVKSKACLGNEPPLPIFDPCPKNMKAGELNMELKAADIRRRRVFVPEFIGEWVVQADVIGTKNTKTHDETTVTVVPRRPTHWGTRYAFFHAPEDFFTTGGGYRLGRLFYTRRLGIRKALLFFNGFEEVRLGGSIGTLTHAHKQGETDMAGGLLGLELDTRIYGPRARQGLAANMHLGGVKMAIKRNDEWNIEYLWESDVFMGYAFSLGNNYFARKSSLCFHPKLCTEILVGLSFLTIHNNQRNETMNDIAGSLSLALNI